jgi:hypothetical protein
MLLADSQVPPGERHPAEERVGLGVLCVLSGPLPAEIEYLQAIQKVGWVKGCFSGPNVTGLRQQACM